MNKEHNYVGIGFYLTGGQFRYYEEFIDRYLEYKAIPATLKVDQYASITLSTGGSCFLYFMTIYREKAPKAMSVKQLSGTGSYPDYSDEIFVNLAPWDLAKFRHGTEYTIPLKFPKEGLYYIHLFTDKKENTGSSTVTTKGKEPVSGIVIRAIR